MLPWPASPAVSAERRLAVTLWCAGVAAFAAMYAPQGLLPQIAADVAAAPSQAALLISVTTLGLAMSVLPWAWLADRWDLRAAMRTAAAAAAPCAVVVPFLPTFETLLVGRFVHGLALGGIPALAMTLSHDIVCGDRAATFAGSYVAATSIGGLTGRLFAVPAAGQWGWRSGLLVLGVGVAVLMLAMIRAIPATAGRRRDTGSIQVLGTHLRDRTIWPVVLVGMLLSGAVMTVFNYLPFRLADAPYGLEPAAISLIFLTYLGGTAGSRATGRLGARYGRSRVLGVAAVMVAAGAAVTVASPLPLVVAGVALLTAGFFVGHAVASSLVAARAATGRAQATALYTIGYYVGSSLFGWWGGAAWSAHGWLAVAALVAVLGIAAAACTTAAAGSPGSRLRRQCSGVRRDCP